MAWSLSEEAKRFIATKGGTVTMHEPFCKRGCCVVINEAPDFTFGVPGNPDAHTVLRFDDVTLYVPLALVNQPGNFTIELLSVWKFRKLVVQGWKLV